ncbi:MAG: HEPN domain-containing protein [Ignavibacteria bacterium]|nr:HEPN domain-containing protein [Ignavibacteria bacterium]
MNREILQKLSELRLKEGKVLYENGFYSGSYYLAGFSIELALKSCIAKTVKKYDFPDKRKYIDSYTHKYDVLLKIANLEFLLNEKKKDPLFRENWDLVNTWEIDSRYTIDIKQDKTKDFIEAIENKKFGILKWIKIHW